MYPLTDRISRIPKSSAVSGSFDKDAIWRSVPQGDERIGQVGHREYVGGNWDELGRLQFRYLLANGLRENHCLLDIGCGALRGGVHFIRYLAPGNYLGIDKEQKLLEFGIRHELGMDIFDQRRPELIVSDRFDFDRFSKRPDVSIAQSLFTHLDAADMRLCMENLRAFVAAGHVCHVTFFEGDSRDNWARSHSCLGFRYSRDEMEEIGSRTGWRCHYIGDWGHPKDQRILRYEAA